MLWQREQLSAQALVPRANTAMSGCGDAAGAAVAGGQAATSADVRGTFHPPVLPDGAIVWQLLVSAPDAGEIGQAQYTG